MNRETIKQLRVLENDDFGHLLITSSFVYGAMSAIQIRIENTIHWVHSADLTVVEQLYCQIVRNLFALCSIISIPAHLTKLPKDSSANDVAVGSCCTTVTSVAGNQTHLKKNSIPKLEAVDRILHIPVVEFGYNYAENVYSRIKKSNTVFYWAFGQAESSLHFVVSTTLPTAARFEGPISAIDKLLCHSLDVVATKVPQINLPPEKIYSNGKEYVNNILVRPILERADSVKQMGTSVLDSKYTAYAADTIEGALNVADKYVDKYLPPEATENETNASDNQIANTPSEKALKTIHHVDVLSRKLQRRLTRRTLAEAKALKEHSTEAIHVFKYVVELIAKDPKLALQKSQELWAALSRDEPENQARPENLEQLVVMLTRESSRRVVHFINFANATVLGLPDQFKSYSQKLIGLLESVLKATHVDNLNHNLVELARTRAQKLTVLLGQLNIFTTAVLGQVAKNLEQQEQNIKKSPTNSKPSTPTPAPTQTPQTNQANASQKHPVITNGIDNVK